MSLGTFARLSLAILVLLAGRAEAQAKLFVETTEIEGAQQRLDAANVTTGPFSGTIPLPAPPPVIAFDASHDGSWLLDYGLGCASAETLWGNAGGNEFGATGVNVAWDDELVVTAPGKSGLGWLDVELGFGGQLSADGDQSRASYGVELSLLGEDLLFMEWFGECTGLSGPNVCTGDDVIGDPFGNYPLPGDDPLRVQFTFGEPITLDIRLDARGEAAQSDRGEAVAAPSLRWLGIAQVLDSGMAPVASYSVTSTSGFDYAQAAGTCSGGGTPSVHDLAFTGAKPKKVSLKTIPTVSQVKLSIQNRGTHDETISDQGTLEDLVHYSIESLGGCPIASALLPPKQGFPAVIRPNGKLTLALELSLACANDPAATTKDTDHSDFRLTLEVDHAALGGADDEPANDVCPRAASGGDKGCGPKTGGDLLIDVIQR